MGNFEVFLEEGVRKDLFQEGWVGLGQTFFILFILYLFQNFGEIELYIGFIIGLVGKEELWKLEVIEVRKVE